MLIIGDSHVAALAPLLGADTSESRKGWTSWRYAQDWPALGDDDLVLIVLGTNDFFLSSKNARDAFGACVEFAKSNSPNARIVWVGPPACDRSDLVGPLGKIASMESLAAAGEGIGFFDSRPSTAGLIGPDGVHATKEGYAAWAAAIQAATADGNVPHDGGPTRLILVGLLVFLAWLAFR